MSPVFPLTCLTRLVRHPRRRLLMLLPTRFGLLLRLHDLLEQTRRNAILSMLPDPLVDVWTIPRGILALMLLLVRLGATLSTSYGVDT